MFVYRIIRVERFTVECIILALHARVAIQFKAIEPKMPLDIMKSIKMGWMNIFQYPNSIMEHCRDL